MNYVPNSFCTRAEYTLLSTLAYKNNKKLVFHIRDEGDFLIESLEEALDIALESGAGLHISHLKCHGKQNWHKTEEVLKFIDRACRLLDFTFDSQPYTSGATTLFAILPPKHLELPAEDLNAALQDDKCLDEIERTIHKGITGWDNYYKSTGPENIVPTGLMHRDNMALKGLSLAEAALICGCSPLRAAARILLLEGSRAGMILNARSEESVIKFLAHPLGMVGSDALYGPDPHPRTHGAFPRYLGCYVREKKIATPIESLYKLTAFPARVFGLKNAGRLEKGSFSDLFIFDPEKIGHYPDSESACPAKPRGIYYVLSKGREYLFPL
jgi:N-acyl-D-amino-acid deacylase